MFGDPRLKRWFPPFQPDCHTLHKEGRPKGDATMNGTKWLCLCTSKYQDLGSWLTLPYSTNPKNTI